MPIRGRLILLELAVAIPLGRVRRRTRCAGVDTVVFEPDDKMSL